MKCCFSWQLIENFEGFSASSQILYLTNITRLLVWNQGKIVIIKWVYFGVLKNALYFGVFKSCMQHKMEVIHFNASFLLA